MFLNKVCVSVNFYNTESTSFYVVSATYSFKVWVGGTSNFYEETKYPPLFPTRFPPVCLTFVLFGPFDHTTFLPGSG